MLASLLVVETRVPVFMLIKEADGMAVGTIARDLRSITRTGVHFSGFKLAFVQKMKNLS